MLVPALLYKAEIDEMITRTMYDDHSLEGFLTPGRVLVSDKPNGATISSQYEWAIIDDDNKLLGRLIYWYHWYDQCLYISGFNSFCEKANPKIGFDVMHHFQHLRETMNIHRVEWRVVSGNLFNTDMIKYVRDTMGLYTF